VPHDVKHRPPHPSSASPITTPHPPPQGGTPIKAYTSAAVNQKCLVLYPPGAPTDCGELHAPCNASVLYNTMLHPLTVGPALFSSFVWFQGEVSELTFPP
jgi:hypothetical protein